MVMAGLFALAAATMIVALLSRERLTVSLFLVTLVLTGLTLWHHMTDPLAISL
jgi:hypothetical protein